MTYHEWSKLIAAVRRRVRDAYAARPLFVEQNGERRDKELRLKKIALGEKS